MEPESITKAESTLVTARLDPSQAEELSRRAKAADRTLSAELRRAVRLYLERAEDEEAA